MKKERPGYHPDRFLCTGMLQTGISFVKLRRAAGTELSGKRDLNPRHPPWQGGALPTELFPRVALHGTPRVRTPPGTPCFFQCERRDLNPQAFWAPDPKSGVSARFHHSRLDSNHADRNWSIRPVLPFLSRAGLEPATRRLRACQETLPLPARQPNYFDHISLR